MMTGVPHDSQGEIELLWEQGSLLPDGFGVLPLQWVHPDHPATKVARGAVTAARRRTECNEPFPVPGPGKDGDRMMVITQTCDLVKPANELPQVEVARIFTTQSVKVIAQAQDFGSARFFRVDGQPGTEAEVLDYGQRAFLDKGFLQAAEPDNRLLDQLPVDRRKMLARWLGQRYARPAVPDEDYAQITRPVRDAWKTLLDEDADAALRFNREYGEWRYRRELDGSLTIYILAAAQAPNDVTALEVTDFLTQALLSYPAPVRVATDKRSYYEFTMNDELTTEQINMEWASQNESPDDAARPM